MRPIDQHLDQLLSRPMSRKTDKELAAIDKSDRRDVLSVRLDHVPWKLRHGECHPDFIGAVAGWSRGNANLILTGPTSAGKSAAAAKLLSKLARLGATSGGEDYEYAKRMRWQSAKELCAVRMDDRFATEEPWIVSRSKRCSLLVLNDLGKERVANGLWDVLEYRYERQHPTITTCEPSFAQLVEFYGDALTRRLVETGNRRATIVEVT